MVECHGWSFSGIYWTTGYSFWIWFRNWKYRCFWYRWSTISCFTWYTFSSVFNSLQARYYESLSKIADTSIRVNFFPTITSDWFFNQNVDFYKDSWKLEDALIGGYMILCFVYLYFWKRYCNSMFLWEHMLKESDVSNFSALFFKEHKFLASQISLLFLFSSPFLLNVLLSPILTDRSSLSWILLYALSYCGLVLQNSCEDHSRFELYQISTLYLVVCRRCDLGRLECCTSHLRCMSVVFFSKRLRDNFWF